MRGLIAVLIIVVIVMGWLLAAPQITVEFGGAQATAQEPPADDAAACTVGTVDFPIAGGVRLYNSAGEHKKTTTGPGLVTITGCTATRASYYSSRDSVTYWFDLAPVAGGGGAAATGPGGGIGSVDVSAYPDSARMVQAQQKSGLDFTGWGLISDPLIDSVASIIAKGTTSLDDRAALGPVNCDSALCEYLISVAETSIYQAGGREGLVYPRGSDNYSLSISVEGSQQGDRIEVYPITSSGISSSPVWSGVVDFRTGVGRVQSVIHLVFYEELARTNEPLGFYVKFWPADGSSFFDIDQHPNLEPRALAPENWLTSYRPGSH